MPTSKFAKPLTRMFHTKHPDRTLLHYGNKARDAQLWTEATTHYAQFLKSNPKNAAIWVQLGNCAKEGRDFKLALEAYDAALALNDKNPDTLLQKGHLLKLTGQIPEAIEYYRRSFALQRQDNPAFNELVSLDALTSDADDVKNNVSTLYVDVTDLIDYLKVNVSLSGIQRVVSNLITHADAFVIANPGTLIKLVLPDYEGSRVYAVKKQHLETIIGMVATGQANRDTLNHLLGQVIQSKTQVVLTTKDTLVIAGAFWIYQRYDLLNGLRHAGIRVTVFIHDLIQVTNPEYVESAATTAFRRSLVDVLCLSSYIMTNSVFVAEDVKKYLKERMNFDLPVIPITLATELGMQEIDTKSINPEYIDLVSEDYVLCVGTIEIRKNHMYLIKIWERLISEFKGAIPNLVFVGKWGWEVDDLRKHLAASDYLGGRLYIYSAISDNDLTFLYKNCLFTVYPSFAEGWGLPVGESLGYGKPCIASKVTAIPEVGGSLCKYIDPFDLDDGFTVISDVLADRAALAAWTVNIQRNFKAKTWHAFSSELYDTVLRYGRDASLSSSQNNCIIESGEIASFGNDPLALLDIEQKRLVTARMTRLTGWHGLESWGCWAARRRATLQVNTRLAPGTDVTVYLRLQTPEGDEVADCTIKIGETSTHIEGIGTVSRWVTAPGRVTTHGTVEILLISGKGFHMRDHRGIYIGIVSLTLAPTADLQARLKAIEHIVPGGLPSQIITLAMR